MQPTRPVLLLGASILLLHLWVALIPERQGPILQVFFRFSILMLLVCICSEHIAELFCRIVSNCLRMIDTATAALAIVVYKMRQLARELKRMDGIGNYRCICGSRKMMSNCCGKRS